MNPDANKGTAPTEGLRERRQRETRQRVAQVGLELFLANGFEATTLDAIAEAAGISRRTFFSHFKSKDEILLAYVAQGWDAVLEEVLGVSPDETPVDAVRSTLARHISAYETDEMVAVDRVMRASQTLRGRKQAGYAMQEQALYEVLCQVWRQPQRRPALRVVAMVSIGAVRLAIDGWIAQGRERPLAEHLEDVFAALTTEIGGQPPA
jgi:AcrR family transcriptional regulator